MESKKRKTWSEISKRKTETEMNSHTLFPILVAALSNNSKSLIKKCLNKLLRLSQPTLLIPILSLLPILLKSKYGTIVRLTAEVVGKASLLSLESNERIALDDEIVKALICLLGNSNRRVWIAACNAVLDLSTASLARQRLLKFSALYRLLFVALSVVNCNEAVDYIQAGLTSIRFEFLQVHKSSTMVSLYTGENGSITSLRIGFKEDAIPAVHFDATINLVNACNIEQLDKIPRRLSECFFVFLKELWLKVRYQMLCSNIIRSTEERQFCVSNITINNLAESTFRLALNAKSLTKLSGHQMVKRCIFGSSEATFENFMLNYWEISPLLIKRIPNTLIEENDLFSSFSQSINFNESFHSFLSSTIQSLISCLPIASDELDILSFLKEGRNRLGCPLIYDQDIRVLRTEKHSRSEVHFFPGCLDICSIKTPYFIYGDDFSKCEEACKEGYTIAMRGMEFRFESVAAISDGFASLFGQPSVGANMYMTPPNSQGLARHYDDHCVFVVQIFGSKQWKVFSQPCVQLPRLYYPRAIVNVEVESSKNEYRQFSLMEGDILYIPRGFLHEACTDNGELSESAGYSLHLTLGVEVEPPFE
ncbi:hypothetical protein Pint_13960 [Pistacia integerrima]|uniref:Uncharacterized protein n=1 Tax=Pistacia integerrima TaxID=434235 RepID=A0ACC0YA70_9ROSI|nr:hypothetical protein Pint_13960 [Pistacia integerrima]